jgi:hypothetical protein
MARIRASHLTISSEQFKSIVKFFKHRQVPTGKFELAYVYEVVTVKPVFDFLPSRRRKAAAEVVVAAIFEQ